MKRCLKCNQTYEDENLNYCLTDGTTLTFESEAQTVVIQKKPKGNKSKILLLLGLFVLIFLGGIGLLAGFLYYFYLKAGENIGAERQNKVNISISPTEVATPRISRTVPPSVEPSPPKNEEIKSSPTDENSEEITPIGWNTTTSGFKGEDGQIYKFKCPPDGTAYTIWGSDVYTADSSICTAAVHAGLFSLAAGGVVTVEYRPGRLTYGSTVRNGITSNTFGEYQRSFAVR